MSYDLIRTVDHAFDDGSEAVLSIHAVVPENSHGDGRGVVSISDQYEHSILIHTREQADRLHRAILAAFDKVEV